MRCGSMRGLILPSRRESREALEWERRNRRIEKELMAAQGCRAEPDEWQGWHSPDMDMEALRRELKDWRG